jgi:REP element-mobilizing transposase RayT
MSLKSYSHAYGESNYYIVLVPKYRRNIFKNIHVARICKMAFQDIADQYGYRIIECTPHIHYLIHSNYSKVSPPEYYFGDFQA